MFRALRHGNARPDEPRGDERLAPAVAVRHLLRADVAAAAAGERDHVAVWLTTTSRITFSPSWCAHVDQRRELGLGAEVRVGRREVA